MLQAVPTPWTNSLSVRNVAPANCCGNLLDACDPMSISVVAWSADHFLEFSTMNLDQCHGHESSPIQHIDIANLMVCEVCDFAWILFRVVRGFSEHVQSYFQKIMYLLHHTAVTKCVSMFATSTGCAAPLSCPRAPTSVTAKRLATAVWICAIFALVFN